MNAGIAKQSDLVLSTFTFLAKSIMTFIVQSNLSSINHEGETEGDTLNVIKTLIKIS